MSAGTDTRRVAKIALTWLAALLLGACGPQDTPEAPSKDEDLMIAEICAESERYVGRVVTLQGLFQDWQVAGCLFPDGAANHPRTRTDWLIRTADDCIYVAGGMPEDLDPMNPENLGCRIELEAEVMQDEDGQVYLVYRNSRRL
jgi:hypothetical protein